jgi:multimeric flavodoxin WrbA
VRQHERRQKEMKFLILNGSLTPPAESNTQRVIDRVREEFKKYSVETKEVVLRNLDFEPGVDITRRDGSSDGLTAVMRELLEADGLIMATPIWWGTYSSYIQAAMERIGYFDDWSIKNNVQPMYGKVFGCLISGGDDGWQHTYGQLFHFASYLGFTTPPDAFVSAVGPGDEDSASQKEFEELVRIFVRNQISWADAMIKTNVGKTSQLQGGTRTGYQSATSFRKGMIGARLK